jgi:hypothetical protein
MTFINPDNGFTVEESLLMGGRKTIVRVDGATVHTTSVIVYQLEPEPPIYQVSHVSYIEPERGHRMIVGQSHTLHDSVDEAIVEAQRINNDPPVQ